MWVQTEFNSSLYLSALVGNVKVYPKLYVLTLTCIELTKKHDTT